VALGAPGWFDDSHWHGNRRYYSSWGSHVTHHECNYECSD
jgi:hypothetical protein